MGDGTYTVRPGRPVQEFTTAQFARALGVSRSAVYWLIQQGVITRYRRPTPRKILISAEELQDSHVRTRGDEGGAYWARWRKSRE